MYLEIYSSSYSLLSYREVPCNTNVSQKPYIRSTRKLRRDHDSIWISVSLTDIHDNFIIIIIVSSFRPQLFPLLLHGLLKLGLQNRVEEATFAVAVEEGDDRLPSFDGCECFVVGHFAGEEQVDVL